MDHFPVSLTPELIRTLDIPGPRYTSYPTAPEWTTDYTELDYRKAISNWTPVNSPISLYIHIPFCSKMCFYCGCNVAIRKSNGNVGTQYIGYLEKELHLLLSTHKEKPEIKQLHLGGGTPNFLTAQELRQLKALIDRYCRVADDAEVAIEVDPRTVTEEQIYTLKEIGFNRISMGIQDFSHDVQVAINRVQPISQVAQLFEWIRSAQFNSINVDLIYGLPKQTISNFDDTVSEIIRLFPDRIALYSYAHVPWLKSHQQLIKVEDLPQNDEKLGIFLNARQRFLESGYDAIGMDHFAKSTDELANAYRNGTLHRNFMGYTVKPAIEFIGIGVSSIGYIQGNFVQNEKEIKRYYEALDQNQLPVDRGLVLSSDDLTRQWVITTLMCQFRLNKQVFFEKFQVQFDVYFSESLPHMTESVALGLLKVSDYELEVTELGRLFVRNIAMGFDAYLKSTSSRRFSKTV